jgi:hypothetical protein
MNFAVLHHEDFRAGSDIGYGFGMSRDQRTREVQQITQVGLALLSDRYHVAGVVEASDPEDAYRKTQNDMPGTDPEWRSRSTSVGDLLYAGDDVPHAWLVLSFGMLDLGPVGDRVMRLLDHEAALLMIGTGRGWIPTLQD